MFPMYTCTVKAFYANSFIHSFSLFTQSTDIYLQYLCLCNIYYATFQIEANT